MLKKQLEELRSSSIYNLSTLKAGRRSRNSGPEHKNINEIFFADEEEDEYLKFQNDAELIHAKLSEELRLMLELPVLIDPEISEHAMSLFEDTFSGYMNVIKDGLNLILEEMADTYEIQQRIREGRIELVNQCFQYLCKYYEKTKPHAVKALERLRLLAAQRVGGASASASQSSAFLSSSISLSAATNEEGFVGGTEAPKTWRDKITLKNAWRLLYRRIPIFKWLPKYYENFFTKVASDALGAITIAFILVPLGLSYAQIASLPPVYGLYAAFFPPMIYMLFGTSAELAVGPASIISLFVPSIADSFGAVGTQEYIDGALFMAMYSGVLMFLAGVLNIGNIVANLLSQPVLSGFMTAAGIIIMMGQLKTLMAIPVSGNNVVDLSDTLWNNIADTNGWTFFLGAIATIVVLSMKYIAPQVPAAFIVLFITTLVSWQIDLNATFGVAIVGEVPSGLPSPRWINALSWSAIQDNIIDALIIALIGYIESIAVAKKYAARRRYRVDVNQELFALGMCNITGSLFQCYPVTGSLSRTATNFVCGVKTQLSSFFVSALLGITLLAFTQAFYHTPLCILAALIIAFTVSILDFNEFFYLLRILSFFDLAQYLFVFIVTLFLGPVVGVIVAVVVSLFQVVYRSTKPTSAVLGRLPGTIVYKDVDFFPNAETIDGVLVLKYDASLFFANINWFWDLLIRFEVKARKKDKPLKAVVVDCSNILKLDSTAIHILTEIIQGYEHKGTLFVLSNVKDKVKETLDAAKLTKMIGERNFFPSTHEAVQYLVAVLDAEEKQIKAEKKRKKEKRKARKEKRRQKKERDVEKGEVEEEETKKKKKHKKRKRRDTNSAAVKADRRRSVLMGQEVKREAVSDRALMMKNVKESWASLTEFKDHTSKKVSDMIGGSKIRRPETDRRKEGEEKKKKAKNSSSSSTEGKNSSHSSSRSSGEEDEERKSTTSTPKIKRRSSSSSESDDDGEEEMLGFSGSRFVTPRTGDALPV